MRRIVLMGNPNVGKSVVFSHLTGVNVIISNYPGTTVDFSRGTLRRHGEEIELIDAPGTYSIHSAIPAEKVAASVLKTADLVINVVDATNLERNLYLTGELLETDKPIVVALNLMDEAERKGIAIDVDGLSERLGVPVIPIVALAGRGLKDLVNALGLAAPGGLSVRGADDRWRDVGRIVAGVQVITHRHRTWLEILSDLSLRPAFGLPLAGAVLALAFFLIIKTGQLVEGIVEGFLIEGPYGRALEWLSGVLGGQGYLHDLLLGPLADGALKFGESLGLLTTGVLVSFGIVLPFLVAFYFVLGLLEDTGVLPRLAVLVDRLLHRVGLHGYAIVPFLLGFGCNVPAMLSARNLESRRERFIACTVVSISVPCVAQLAVIVGLVGRTGGEYLAVVFATLLFVMISLGLLLDRLVPGFTPSLILEIPPLRLPHAKSLFTKLWMRTSEFLLHAVPWIWGGIVAMNMLDLLGIIDAMARISAPVMTGLFGLPAEAVSSVLIGFLRKDVAVVMLEPLGMTASQLAVGSTLLAIYFPCAATFVVLARELGPRDTLKSAGIMILTSLVVGTGLNLLLDRVLPAAWLAVVLVAVAFAAGALWGGSSERREFSDVPSQLGTPGR